MDEPRLNDGGDLIDIMSEIALVEIDSDIEAARFRLYEQHPFFDGGDFP